MADNTSYWETDLWHCCNTGVCSHCLFSQLHSRLITRAVGVVGLREVKAAHSVQLQYRPRIDLQHGQPLRNLHLADRVRKQCIWQHSHAEVGSVGQKSADINMLLKNHDTKMSVLKTTSCYQLFQREQRTKDRIKWCAVHVQPLGYDYDLCWCDDSFPSYISPNTVCLSACFA